jgi:hypothetical protein
VVGGAKILCSENETDCAIICAHTSTSYSQLYLKMMQHLSQGIKVYVY